MRAIEFDSNLIARYDRPSPRYTSYPTAVHFRADFTEHAYREQAYASRGSRPLSLYFHLPFCNTVCFYCACNKIVTKNRARAAPYLKSLQREIEMQGALFERERTVEQLHWGGGTPTFISHDEMRALMAHTRRYFRLRDDDRGEYGIEVDPRELRPGTLSLLRELGFNRLSIGIQDFDPAVQKAINRFQNESQTTGVMNEARALGFRSVNVDLIYGLPRQTVASFTRTLDKVIAADPDRLSVFNYAHLPKLFKVQRQIDPAELPDPQTKLDILRRTIEKLTQAGYEYIGMDHFAKPDDELAVAQRQGTLTRNFQGYSTHADSDLIGLGVTAIGSVADSYTQNAKTLEEYCARVDAGRLPIMRGLRLDADDRLRRDVIRELICHFFLNIRDIEEKHGIVFRKYFRAELTALSVLAHDGLVKITPHAIRVSSAGRLLIRNLCMVWDRYLPRALATHSRAI